MDKAHINAAVAGLGIILGLSIMTAFSTAHAAECVRMKNEESLGKPKLKEIRSPGGEFRNLDEFSGLTVAPDRASPGGFSFWTIDDENSLLIRFLTTGEIVEAVRIEGGEDLEAIAFDPTRNRLAIISEHSGRVQFLERKGARGFEDAGEFTLSELPGYDEQAVNDTTGNTLKAYYEDYTQFDEARGETPNSGWEGMTFAGDGTMYFLKEKNPAMLIRVELDETDLKASKITAITMLNCGSRKEPRLCDKIKKNAFIFDDEVEVNGKDENLDFSGLAYADKKLWITSDQGRSVIHFDPEKPNEYISYPLEYDTDKCLDSPEGVAVSGDGKQLFIVNDQPAQEDSRLLIYDIPREPGR